MLTAKSCNKKKKGKTRETRSAQLHSHSLFLLLWSCWDSFWWWWRTWGRLLEWITFCPPACLPVCLSCSYTADDLLKQTIVYSAVRGCLMYSTVLCRFLGRRLLQLNSNNEMYRAWAVGCIMRTWIILTDLTTVLIHSHASSNRRTDE